MHDIPKRIADVLLEMKSILRASGKWESKQPPRSALTGNQPFCIDTLEFEQRVFPSSMRQMIEAASPLPPRSGIHPYAEEYLPKKAPCSRRLLENIRRFDDLIGIQSQTRRH